MLFLFFAFFSNGAVAADPEFREFPAGAIRQLDAGNTEGNLTMHTEDGAKARVEIVRGEFDEKGCSIHTDMAGSTLRIRVLRKKLFRKIQCRVDFKITVPSGIGVKIAAGTGNVSVAGTYRFLDFAQGSGQTDVEGDFGKLDGKSGTGGIRISATTSTATIKTGTGAVALKLHKAPDRGTFSFVTGTGDVNFFIPNGAKVKTSFTSGTGQLTNELGESPDAPIQVSFKSGTGNLKISRVYN